MTRINILPCRFGQSKRILGAAILAFLATTMGSEDAALAQWGIGALIRDYRQPVTYSPDDPFNRSSVFRYHTGHSGRFFNCDEEESKRCSPYIRWQTVDNTTPIRPWHQVLICDLREVQQRVRDGSCRECENVNTTMSGYAKYRTAAGGTINSDRQSGVPIDGESSSHLAYGSRATRAATAASAASAASAATTAQTKTPNASEPIVFHATNPLAPSHIRLAK